MIDLAIVLITYNRSAYLARTLASLGDSVFRDCEIWLLNNASTDATLEVCESFKPRLPNLRVVTHPFNLGGVGNVLRAYEYGSRTYTWILCDDDTLHLNHVDDVIGAIESKAYDLIRVYGGTTEELGRSCRLEELLHDTDSFSFYSLGFIPAIIFRRECIGRGVIAGYQHTNTLYPQLFVLLRAFGPDSMVYTSKSPLLDRGNAPVPTGSEIVLAQIRSLAALPTERARRVAMSWRRRRQRLLGYMFGYGRLILADLRFGRSRRMIASIWVRTILASPSWVAKGLILLNGIFILAPIRLVYRIVRGRQMEPRSFPDR